MNQVRQKIERKIFDQVREKFELLDKGTSREKKATCVTEKEERYRSFVALGLVRIEQYGHPLFSEWVPREDAAGLEITDPAVWLKSREKKTFEIKSRRGEWVIGKGWVK